LLTPGRPTPATTRWNAGSRRRRAALDEWQELNVRWFHSTFAPILRAHGTDRPREPWNIANENTDAYRALQGSAALRYMLFPYIYSVAGAVTHDGSTMMRPLVMDFRNDPNARDITDEYMFGPAFLVCPVTEYKARSRTVYLPAGTARRLLDGHARRRRPDDYRRRATRADAGLRARGVDRSERRRAAVHRREARCASDIERLCRCRRPVHAL
jgi:hypothetical protein